MTDEQWPTPGWRCWEDGDFRWRWNAEWQRMEYTSGTSGEWHISRRQDWNDPDSLVAHAVGLGYPNFREVTPPPDLSRRVEELEAANKWLAELLTEALPYVEEVEAHHKPGRNKLGKMIRVAVADQVTPK